MCKNVLIVDDSELNVEILQHLIEKYSKEKDIPLNILIASNGQIAVEICKETSIDLIFMDLMMPIMDGIEATKIIKKQYPKVMIIAVSAVGDEAKQNEMLIYGAEDYLMKPIVSSIFYSRLNNYVQLIQNRHHISKTPKAHNLFTSKIYNYNMNFLISSEEHLSEFWEAMLIRFDFQKKIVGINDFIRFLYMFGTIQIQQKFMFNIFVEEDSENFYFTINNIKLIGCEKVFKLIETYFSIAIFYCDENKLSFTLNKKSDDYEESSTKIMPIKIDIPKEPIEQYVHKPKNEEIQTYNILDTEEISELEDFLYKINSIVLLMENSSIDIEEIGNLASYLNSMSTILSMANDAYIISNSLQTLSSSILENTEFFYENSNMLFEFINAFIHDLIFWKTKIFYDGAPSVDFLNESISTNANMLNALLKPEENNTEDLDDIFDF